MTREDGAPTPVTAPQVAAVIVNFNAGEALADALASLPAGLGDLAWEAVVVDNASTDGSERAAEGVPRVRLIRRPVNEGFATGVNHGVAATRAPEVLLLNPDGVLTAGAVPILHDELTAETRCGVVGPRILDPDGTLQQSARGDPTLWTGLFGRTGLLARWFPGAAAVRRNLVAGAGTEGGGSVAVDWVSGACMLVRREALAGVAGFDEGYFLYWEDADLCRRLRRAGWGVRYVPAATVVHRVGRSSRSARRLAIRAFHDSAYRYYATHVVPRPWHPARGLARAVLAVRCAWKLLAAPPPGRTRAPAPGGSGSGGAGRSQA